jgi:hypothetical protein
VEEDPGTCVLRIAAAESIAVPIVWRILYEQSLNPHHIQRVQALTPPDRRATVVCCQWFLAKCVVSTQFVANILFTDEEGFTRDGILKFHPCVGEQKAPTPPSHQDIKIDFLSRSGWASYVINTRGQFSYLTDSQVQFTIVFW